MKNLYILFALFFSITAFGQLEDLSIPQLEARKTQAIEARDFLTAEAINTELLGRKSLDELRTHYNALKSKAADENNFEKAAFYADLVKKVDQLEELDAKIEESAQAEDYVAAARLQKEFNALKTQTLSSKYGATPPVASTPEPVRTTPTNTANAETITQRILPSAITTSRGTSTKPQTKEYVVTKINTIGFADYTSFEEGALNFPIENTHMWNVGKENRFGVRSGNTVNHGAFIGGFSYGFNYFDYQISSIGTYGTSYWAKGGVGYQYSNDFVSVYSLLNQGIVSFTETTTGYYDWDGYWDYDDASYTSWFPENSTTIKVGATFGGKPNGKTTQWAGMIAVESPLSGGSSVLWIGIASRVLSSR